MTDEQMKELVRRIGGVVAVQGFFAVALTHKGVLNGEVLCQSLAELQKKLGHPETGWAAGVVAEAVRCAAALTPGPGDKVH